MRARIYAYQGVTNASFSKNFAYVLNEWSPSKKQLAKWKLSISSCCDFLLIHFKQIFLFFTSWTHQKTSSFLMYSGVYKWNIGLKLVKWRCFKRKKSYFGLISSVACNTSNFIFNKSILGPDFTNFNHRLAAPISGTVTIAGWDPMREDALILWTFVFPSVFWIQDRRSSTSFCDNMSLSESNK